MKTPVPYVLGAVFIAVVLAFQIFGGSDPEPEQPQEPQTSAPVVELVEPTFPTFTPDPDPDVADEPLKAGPDLNGDGEVTAEEVIEVYNLPPGTDVSGGFVLDEGDNEVRFDQKLVKQAARAWSTWSWKDENPNSWTDRVALMSTSFYGDSLRRGYPLTAVVKSDWDAQFVAPRGQTRVVKFKSKLRAGSEQQGWLEYTVRYVIQARYQRPAKAREQVNAGKGQWVRLNAVSYDMRFVVENGQWLLDDVREGSPGAF